MSNILNFSESYVDIYHLMNSEKNYQTEMQFVLKKYSEFTGVEFPASILDLGCGLGDHLKFVPNEVKQCVGVDLSPKMINKARKLNSSAKISFILSDIGEYSPMSKFQLVFSLFHVLSYQCKMKDLMSFFRTISEALDESGIAVVDFWHRPVWDQDPPIVRKTQRQTELGTITRISYPNLDVVNGLVEIDMQIEILTAGEKPIRISESHAMRAFTILELELATKLNNLKILESGDWNGLEGNPLSSSTWYGYVVIKKDDDASGK